MNCREVRELFGAYYDSELEASMIVHVNRHLETCAACRLRFDAESRIETAVASRLRRDEPSDDAVFAAGLAAASGGVRPRRWRGALLSAGAAGAAVVAVAIWLTLRESPPEFVTVAIHDHAKYRAGAMAPHVETDRAQAVRAYLEPKVGVPVGALPSGDAWSIRGPRLCYLRSVAVGLVMLEHHGIRVSLFVTSADAAASFGDALPSEPSGFELPGGNAAIVERDGIVRCAVGDIPRVDLEHLVAGFRGSDKNE